MIDNLIKLANHLDSIGELEESDFADKVIDKIARNTLVFDLDSGEVFDKGIRDWRNPTDGELANAFFGDPEPLGDVGDLNPDSISYKKDEDGNDGKLYLRDEGGKPLATLRVDEPPEYEISWHNLSRKHVDSRPKNMTLPDGNSVTIKEIKLESTKMIKELIKLATHLDSKGLVKEADYLDGIIEKKSQDFGMNYPYERSSKEPSYDEYENKYRWMQDHVDWANEQNSKEIKTFQTKKNKEIQDRQAAWREVKNMIDQLDLHRNDRSPDGDQQAKALEEKLEKSIDFYHGSIKK